MEKDSYLRFRIINNGGKPFTKWSQECNEPIKLKQHTSYQAKSICVSFHAVDSHGSPSSPADIKSGLPALPALSVHYKQGFSFWKSKGTRLVKLYKKNKIRKLPSGRCIHYRVTVKYERSEGITS
jgi:hypothetical protein